MENNLEHRIRERAYAIWNEHGRIEGQADQHWLTAERELLTTMVATLPASTSAPSRKPRSRATPAARTKAPRAAAR